MKTSKITRVSCQPKEQKTWTSNQSGFALISTIVIMSLLLMLCFGMLTISSTEVRTSSVQNAQFEAQANARLALMCALQELQEATGPDQRITANARIKGESIKQPHLLGVWKSYREANTSNSPMSYATHKSDDFIQWLSSMPDAQKTDINYPYNDPDSDNSVTLVGEGSLPESVDGDVESAYLKARIIELQNANGVENGKYAWAVFDESQKASLSRMNPDTNTDAQRVSALSASGKSGIAAYATTNEQYKALAELTTEQQSKIPSLKSSDLIGNFDTKEAKAFLFLNTESKNLLVDVVNGGYQKDLSLLFDNTTLPTEYLNRHIYSDSDTPVAAAPTRFAGADPMPSPDPKWSLLHSHYRLYNDVSVKDNAYGVSASSVDRSKQSEEYFSKQQLYPVISNAQFIFSMSAEKITGNPESAVNRGYDATLALWQDIVITVWNPYNVELRLDGLDIEFYRLPLSLEFFRNNGAESATGTPVHIGTMFSSVDNNSYDLPYRGRITGSSEDPDDNDIILKPGEYKVFGTVGAANRTYHTGNRSFGEGLTLGEGFDHESGGIHTVYLGSGPDGVHIGKWNGRGDGYFKLNLKNTDVISVQVSSAKGTANVTWPETNQKEIAAYVKTFKGDGGFVWGSSTSVDDMKAELDANRIQMGAIELDMSDTLLQSKLGAIPASNLRQLNIAEDGIAQAQKSTNKIPFLIASLRLKTELDAVDADGDGNASQIWLQNGITNPYFTTGLNAQPDQNKREKTNQYELTWEPMSSWSQIPGVAKDSNNRGYGASGVDSSVGVNYAPFAQIPLLPASSIAQFVHAPLNAGGQAPLTTQIVGNSFNSPLIPLAKFSNSGSLGTHLDHSYMANSTLFDSYFLSTATTESGPLYETSGRDLDTVISDFFTDTASLPNPNFEPTSNIAPTIDPAVDYATFAEHLYNNGAFNVNSTSVEAWALFLGSGSNESLPILDMLTASNSLGTSSADTVNLAVSRFSPLIGDELTSDDAVDTQNRWAGHRRLTPEQIMTLAENVVDEVKERGPFQSISEFVNRRIDSIPETANSGALQTAIDNSNLNTEYGMAAPKNNTELGSEGTANTSDGANSQITQADLLNRLAPSITVRGDTFRIRTYGEATVNGITAKAWCEAVVQRGHNYIDSSQPSTTSPVGSSLNATNETFGRRYEIISFRWLAPNEI